MSRRIDSHQHFWKYNPVRDSWITDEMHTIQKDFLPIDLWPELIQSNIDGCVAVQADSSMTETYFLLDQAKQHPWILGVVGWIDLCSELLTQHLEYLADRPALVGFRHILQAEPGGFMLQSSFVNGLQSLRLHGYTYDLLITEHQLPEAYELLLKVPEAKIVIDHIAKPDIRKQSYDQWALWMTKMSDLENVNVKISGMITEADWQQWHSLDFTKYFDLCMELFGADRLMFGSDWPVCLVAGKYGEVVQLVENAIRDFSAEEQKAIMGGTASKFYHL